MVHLRKGFFLRIPKFPGRRGWGVGGGEWGRGSRGVGREFHSELISTDFGAVLYHC